MITIIVVHMVAVLLAPTLIKFLHSKGFLFLAAVPFISGLWILTQFASCQITPIHERITWIPQLHINIDEELSPITATFALLVLFIGAIVLLYCAWYFSGNSARLGIFSGEMIAFAGIMFALVCSNNMLMLFIFWELTSVLSFLLIGYYPDRAISRRAAAQALLVTTIGGLAMLGGIIMLGEKLHTYSLERWIDFSQHTALVHSFYIRSAIILLLWGALSKSAILPLHFWLPDAMAAPTPVSAYLHSAAMVKAGVFLIGALSFGLAHDTMWRAIIATLGLITMILGGWFALQEYDLKLILAYGTVSQLGFISTIISFGGSRFAQAGLAMVIAHACFKSTLFMVVGIIDHATRTRDIRKLAGLGIRLPTLAIIAAIACCSMAGVPATLGFLAKEAALHAAWSEHTLAGIALYLCFIIGSILTCAYSMRFLFGGFSQKSRRTSVSVIRLHKPHIGIYVSPVITALACIIFGIFPHIMNYLTAGYTRLAAQNFPHSNAPSLMLWHGWTIELWSSLIILICGYALALQHYRLDKYYARILRYIFPPQLRTINANDIYETALKATDIFAHKITRATQRGSLPTSLSVIFATFCALSFYGLCTGEHPIVHLIHTSWLTLVIAIITCFSALTATMLRNRLSGALVIGVTGYSCVTYFAISGAPDLALTQAAAESLLLVFYVLGVRNFGAELGPLQIQGKRLIRAGISIAVGFMVVLLGLYSSGARHTTPLYQRLPSAAYIFSHGRNTVNVILIDIRSWDTLWESTVLLLAATGVVSLVFRNRRHGGALRVADALEFAYEYPKLEDHNFWLASSRIRSPKNRSIILEVTARLIFPSLMMFSIYLLFAGHNHPGGGFAAGLIAGSSIALRYIAGGSFELGEAIALEPSYFLGGGLILGCISAISPIFNGQALFTSSIWHIHLPFYGNISIVSPFIFDLGVYLIVIGVVLDILRALGARLDLETAIRKSDRDDRSQMLASLYTTKTLPLYKGKSDLYKGNPR